MVVTRKVEIHLVRPNIVKRLGTNECLRTQHNRYDRDVYKRSRNFVVTSEAVHLRCRECERLLPATRSYFPVDSRYRHGYENHCRDCKAGYMRSYRRRRKAG